MPDQTDVRVTVLPHGEGLALPAHADAAGVGREVNRQRDLAWHLEQDAIADVEARVA
ncbi:hypothetical protein [Rubrivirga sp.]|uniref:hypothetical protein n=1 Tax=Rubrivirga sp. TaxID=1885344 RepID=UPI003B528298